MKKVILFKLLIILLSLVKVIYAQKPIAISEANIKYQHGTYPGLELIIPELDYETTTKAWVKTLEKGTKSDLTIEDGEYTIFGAQINEIYENPINIYSILSHQDSAISIKATFELKPKEFISPEQSEREFALAKDFLFSFGKEQYIELASTELKNEEKELRDFEKDLSSLQNDKTKLEKLIVSEKNNILKLEDEIIMLKQDAQNLNTQIGQEKEILLNISGEEAIAAKEETIKELEKQKDKKLKEIENSQKKIVSSNSAIERAKLDIESNVRDQSQKSAELDKQKMKVSKAATKLSTIQGY